MANAQVTEKQVKYKFWIQKDSVEMTPIFQFCSGELIVWMQPAMRNYLVTTWLNQQQIQASPP